MGESYVFMMMKNSGTDPDIETKEEEAEDFSPYLIRLDPDDEDPDDNVILPTRVYEPSQSGASLAYYNAGGGWQRFGGGNPGNKKEEESPYLIKLAESEQTKRRSSEKRYSEMSAGMAFNRRLKRPASFVTAYTSTTYQPLPLLKLSNPLYAKVPFGQVWGKYGQKAKIEEEFTCRPPPPPRMDPRTLLANSHAILTKYYDDYHRRWCQNVPIPRQLND